MIGPLLVIAAGAVLGVRAASEPLHAGSKKLSPWALMGDFDRALEEGDLRGAALLLLSGAKKNWDYSALKVKIRSFNDRARDLEPVVQPQFILSDHGLTLLTSSDRETGLCEPRESVVKALVSAPGWEIEPRQDGYLFVISDGYLIGASDSPNACRRGWWGHDEENDWGLYEIEDVPHTLWQRLNDQWFDDGYDAWSQVAFLPMTLLDEGDDDGYDAWSQENEEEDGNEEESW